ncbi:MAG: ferritin family protein [bacterium]|nr:ferritin family protein [bacterium]
MEKLEFVIENELGHAKNNEELKASLNAQFTGETAEVGLYLAMARVAQRAGYPEIAEVLKVIAWEEAEHAAQYAELTGKVSDCTKTNLTNMMKGEVAANKFKAELAQKAREAGLEELYTFIDHAARDEARHASMLHGMINRVSE